MTVLHSAILVSSLWRVFPITLSSPTDIPSLTTITLPYAFKRRKTIHTKSSSSSSPSFLDITPALQQYLKYPLSFTHDSPSILSKRIIHPSYPSLSSHHTHPQFPSEECVRMCHSITSLPLDPFPSTALQITQHSDTNPNKKRESLIRPHNAHTARKEHLQNCIT